MTINFQSKFLDLAEQLLPISSEAVFAFLQNAPQLVNQITISQIEVWFNRGVELLNNNDFYINNLDINLICEQPKVSKFRDKIIKSLSKLLDIDKEIINLKGKTVEKLGLIGKEKAIACEVICSISQ